jgi:RND superfamily putative drug exporter
MTHRRTPAPAAETTTSGHVPGWLGRLGGAAYRHRGRVLLLWAGAFATVLALSMTIGGTFSADYTAPGSDSTKAHDLLAKRFPVQAGDTLTIVARAESGPVSAAANARQVDALITEVTRIPHVAAVDAPWHTPGAISPDETTAKVEVHLDVDNPVDMPIADTTRIVALVKGASHSGLQVAVGGAAVGATEGGAIGSEGVGMGAAAIILLLTFGSVVAAGLPIMLALIGIAISAGLTIALTAALPVPDWSTSLVAMMVIGIGIDYAMLMVTRFREWRSHGLSVEQASVATMDTAGRSVLLAGTTVVISMLGLFAMGLSFMRGAAVVTIAGVLVVIAASLTLFPALLGYFGRRIDRLRLPLPRGRNSGSGRGWTRWSAFVQKHRYAAAGIGIAVMVALAAPFLGVRFGSTDAGNDAVGTSTRTAYDMSSTAFGAGSNGPLLVVLEHATSNAVTRVTAAVSHTTGVAAVQPAVTDAKGTTSLLTVVPTTGPQAAATASLVRRLRETALPAAVAGTGSVAHVGGMTAAVIDSDANTTKRIPLLLAGVVGLSVLLLLIAFRSVAIALKAAAMNLLSVGASFGVVALALQGGWFGRLVGVSEPTPLPAFVPVLMFAILFSLSADYEIFLVSRMRDAYQRTGDNSAAVRTGLASTAKVITAAAAIMVAVFAAFIPSADVTVKMIGVGLVAAILIDATIIRMLLVPAFMHILGDRNWWIPRWLDRILPSVAVDGHEERYLPVAGQATARELVGAGA